jgi:hypothetical protein
MVMDRTFFDIHMHAMDMSHPNLLAFAKRIWRTVLKLVFSGDFDMFLHAKEENFFNLLTVMENSIEDYFILMEYFLKSKEPVLGAGSAIRIGTREFDTILLTPLIMDFGLKQMKTNTFYNMIMGKPVVGQTVDILNAIRKYCNCEFAPKAGKDQEGTTVPRTSRRLFEIYPFLGINTRHYDLDELKELLDRCFSGYTGRRDDLHGRMGTFDGAIERVGSNVFAGIKLYPPLGFDPWPEDESGESGEMEKVKYLYSLCEERHIPVTAHCNDGGFAIDRHSKKYSNPDKWRQVLGQFPQLKLNLAHFGNQGKLLFVIPRHGWCETVIDLIHTHDNVYTDISCLAFDDHFYGELNELLADGDPVKRDKLPSRILFGSDYMMNLVRARSYNDYLATFIRTKQIADKIKVLLCNENAVRFMFR